MSAYVITDIEITDPEGYKTYQQMGPPTVAKFGGRFVARGGCLEMLEGTWGPKRMVILEFDSVERAREWWASEDYRPAKAVRHKTAKTNMVIVEGL